MTELMRILALTLLLTSFLAVEVSSVRRAIAAYMVQALVMVAIIASFATLHPGLWLWAVTALATKFALISYTACADTRGTAGKARIPSPIRQTEQCSRPTV